MKKQEIKEETTVTEESSKEETVAEEIKEENPAVEETEVEATKDEDFVIREDGVADPVIPTEEVVNFEYDSDPLIHIEEERKAFLAKYKKQNTLKWVVSIVAFVVVLAAWIIIPNVSKGESWSLPVTLSIVGVDLGFILFYTFWVRKSLNKKMRDYFTVFYAESNRFVFEQEGFGNIEGQNPDKISMDQFTDCGLYKDIIEVGSRGLTSVEYHNIPIMVCDCAGQIKTEKRIAPVFVGKYLFAASNYEGDEPIYIYLKGDKRSLPPTNMEDIKRVHDDNKMSIWSKNSKWDKTVNTAFKKLLSQIHLSKDLVDLSIAIKAGQVFVCMGYDDPLMVLPLEKPYNPNPIKTYKKDVVAVAKIIEALNK